MNDYTRANPVRVYAEEHHARSRFTKDAEFPVVVGGSLYGARLKGPLTLDSVARNDLVRAIWLIRWYRDSLLMRFGPEEDVSEVTEILDILHDE